MVRLARTSRCAMVGSGTRNARAMAGVWMPATVRRVRATRASADSSGWQQVKMSRSRSSVMGSGVVQEVSVGVDLDPSPARACEGRLLLDQPTGAPDAVDGATASRGGDPGARPVGDAVRRPVLEGGEERVLDRLLGGVEVAAEGRDEAREDTSALGAEDLLPRPRA